MLGAVPWYIEGWLSGDDHDVCRFRGKRGCSWRISNAKKKPWKHAWKAVSLRDKFGQWKILENQKIVSTSMRIRIFWHFISKVTDSGTNIFIRSGKWFLLNTRWWKIQTGRAERVMNSHVKQFYGDFAFIPKEILIQSILMTGNHRKVVESSEEQSLHSNSRREKHKLLDGPAKRRRSSADL